jgi:HK97 family phage major capsid protein
VPKHARLKRRVADPRSIEWEIAPRNNSKVQSYDCAIAVSREATGLTPRDFFLRPRQKRDSMPQNNIFALRQRDIELVAHMQKLLDTSKSAGRDFTAAEAKDFDATRILVAKNKVLIAEAEANLDRELTMPAREILGDGSYGPLSADAGIGRPKRGKAAKYAELFGLQGGLDRGGFASYNEFFSTVNSGLADPRLRFAGSGSGIMAAGTQREAQPSSGGFLIPTEFAAQVLDVSLETEIVRPRALVWPMTSDTRKVPAFDDLDHTGGGTGNVLLGGISAAWENELDGLGNQKAKLRLIELHAKKMALLVQSSNELIEDSDFEAVIGAKLYTACSWILDEAFLNGKGAGQPLGVFNDPALIVVAKESGQATATLQYENITKMFGRLHPTCRRNAVWVTNSDCIPQLLQMQNVVWNVAHTDHVGGSAVPIVTKNADGSMEMLTLPIIFSEKLAALGTQGDLLLADFSQYSIGIRREIRLEKSLHAGFSTDSTFFRLSARVDGQGTWKTALTPAKGANSLSWAVTLAARP